MKLKNKLNEILKNHDFGYDVNLISNDDWQITEQDDGTSICHCIIYVEFIEEPNSTPHKGHVFAKINKDFKMETFKVNIEDIDKDNY